MVLPPEVVNLLSFVAYKRACTGYSNVVDCCFRLHKSRRSFDMPLRRNRRDFTQLTEFERGRIIGIREAGWSYRRIASYLRRSDHTVRTCWDQWMHEGTHTRRLSARREESRILRQARTDPAASSPAILRQLAPLLQAPVSARTISRTRLKKSWSHGALCRERQTWTAEDWNRIVFSDESRFSLSSDDGRVRVWRPRGARLNPTFAVARHTAATAGVLVWGSSRTTVDHP
ncbi:hypothetical protein ANN_10685 [Periplaneta americana]|uniref:Transposase n=1 Tax=Periplaneta americana TaxID=6978 RepID=A0ABQ8T4F9_PERAM|nr:hypothetical protein ANN_10685 [Periplaneta americana]